MNQSTENYFDIIKDGIQAFPPVGIPIFFSSTKDIITSIEEKYSVTCDGFEEKKKIRKGQKITVWICRVDNLEESVRAIDVHVLASKKFWIPNDPELANEVLLQAKFSGAITPFPVPITKGLRLKMRFP